MCVTLVCCLIKFYNVQQNMLIVLAQTLVN